MAEEDTAFLVVTTWVGFLGVHYYGSIWFNGKRKDLEWIPPDGYRKMLNSLEDKKFSQIKNGQKTIKFLREGDVDEEAVKQYKIMYPKAKCLLKGNPAGFGGMDLPKLDPEE